jgi:hypothetical protein
MSEQPTPEVRAQIKREALLDLAAHMCRDCKRGLLPVVQGAEREDGGHEYWHRGLTMFVCYAGAAHEAISRLCPEAAQESKP